MKRAIITVLLLIYGSVLGNGIQLRNLVVDQAAQTVTFDIRWFNAWRFNNSEPLNWDAAWIFVKFKGCNDDWWTHGLLSTNEAEHILPPELEFINSDGTANEIENAPENTGALVRSSVATGDTLIDTLGWYTITLKVTNLPTTGAINVKVFAIEMVFIPQGAYKLGGLAQRYWMCEEGAYSFGANCCNSCARTPIDVTSEDPLTVRWGNCYTINLPAAYPKGFNAFHVMKYEISQGQYADFLNTLPPIIAQTYRYPGNFNSFRNRLTDTGTPPNKYVSDRPDRAQNWLGPADVLAYLDWAALRPMTELEYEKICRGKDLVIDDQYPWGLSTAPVPGTIFNKSPEDGTELFVDPDANCTFNNITFSSGDGGQGPARVGIHVKPSQFDRVKSGLSYYGVPDMAGNVWEVTVHVRQTGYTKNWGDGDLDAFGEANEAGWPGYIAYRGGSWGNNWWDMRISARCGAGYAGHGGASWNRHEHIGGRGVR